MPAFSTMKRFLRFRLRTLFILVTAFCVYLGWHVHATRQQEAAVAAIAQYGGWVYYDFQIVGDKFDPKAKSWIPEWLRSRLGNDFFHSVVQVNLVYNEDGPQRLDNRQTSADTLQYVGELRRVETLLLQKGQATDENLHHLKRLKRLRRLYMWDANELGDIGIEKLKDLPKLEYIHCSNARLTDTSLRIFGQMPKLTSLTLQENNFTDHGLAHLSDLHRLTNLWIGMGDTRITDAGLRYLHGLKSLQTVEFQESPVTLRGIDELRAAIPKVHILHKLVERRPSSRATTTSRKVK